MEIKTIAKINLRSLVCIEPATSFGDDIEIFVDGISAGGQFPIDQGQSKDLTRLDPNTFEVDDNGVAYIQFFEDSDKACELKIEGSLVGKGTQKRNLRIKNDGIYDFFFKVVKKWDDKSKEIVGDAVKASIGTNIIFQIPITGVPLSFTYLTGVWVAMVVKLLQKYDHPFNVNTVSKFVASIVKATLDFALGFSITNSIVSVIPFNIFFVLPIEIFVLALVTYRFGKFCDEEFSSVTFTVDTFGQLGETFLKVLGSYKGENIISDVQEMITTL